MNFDETPHTNDFFVSFDNALIDHSFVLRQLAVSYWASQQPAIVTLRALDHSLCAGVYLNAEGGNKRQVGFARAITDHATFCWICDVLIDPEYRKKGLGKFLIEAMLKHPSIGKVNCLLRTQDAHGLYAKFGFLPVDAMRRLPLKP